MTKLHQTWIIFLAISGVLLHAWLGQSWPDTSAHAIGSDDAYISFRYAQNLSDGHGLVFNPGEKVEGYSNLLYTLLMTPAFMISKDAVYHFSVLINCLLLATTIWVFYGFLMKKFGQEKAIIGTLILALNPWILLNSATGLETTLILTITTISWLLLENFLETRNSHVFIGLLVFCCLSILSRVDGFLLPMAMSLYALLKGDKKLAASLLSFIVVLAVIYTSWRYFYYQDIIANTYYAKVSGNLLTRLKVGRRFVLQYAVITGLWIPIIITGIQWLRAIRNRELSQSLSFSGLFIALWMGYLIFIGGDFYFERFTVALIPMGIYISMHLYHSPRHFIAKLIGVIFIASQFLFVIRDGRFDYRYNKYDSLITAGKFLGKHYPGSTVALDAAGKIPFYSGLNTIDMLGLNDKHIGKMQITTNSFFVGHNKFDPQYVLAKKPALIAACMKSDGENLAWNMNNFYHDHYFIKYLVNDSREDKHSENIIDVSMSSKENIVALFKKGYTYAILLRK